MNIGQASTHSGLSPKTIRYYESVGLVVPRRQADNRYRIYSAADVRHLRFLHHARQAGFGLSQSRELLALYRDPSQLNEGKRALVIERVEWLEAQRQSLADMRDLLLSMAQSGDASERNEHSLTQDQAPIQTHGMSFTLLESKR